MTIHLMVEGASERWFFEGWAPRLRFEQAIRIHPHQGKGTIPANHGAAPDPKRRGLLDQLPAKLRGFAETLNPDTDGIIVLVDCDDDNAVTLAAAIHMLANAYCPTIKVEVCIATEETEAFYLADRAALLRAYPNHDQVKVATYVPDSICSTWELFGEVINDDSGNKVAWAGVMGKQLTTAAAQSRSPSFRNLRASFDKLGSLPVTLKAPRRKYRHPAKKKGKK